MNSSELHDQVEHLARELTALMNERAHRHLTCVHVTCPPGVQPRQVKVLLARRLAESGIDFVDVYPHEEPGPLRLLAAYVQPAPGQPEVEAIGPGGTTS